MSFQNYSVARKKFYKTFLIQNRTTLTSCKSKFFVCVSVLQMNIPKGNLKPNKSKNKIPSMMDNRNIIFDGYKVSKL